MTTSVPLALVNRELIVVDVEGNGQSPPEIIEFAGLPIDKAVVGVADMQTWLIQPVKPIAAVVTRTVHGIRTSDVASCPLWAEVAPSVSAVLAGRTLIAHGAHVERRVIGAHLPDWQPPAVVDTMRLAKYVWPHLSGYGLEKLVEHAELDVTAVADQRPHRAAYDTWCAWQLLRTLVERSSLDWPGIVEVAALPTPAASAEEQGRLW